MAYVSSIVRGRYPQNAGVKHTTPALPTRLLTALGQKGRMLLAQYIRVKSQQRIWRNVAYDCSMKGNVSMSIKIITAPARMQGYDVGHISVDLGRKTGVLMRQSRKGADKDHYESRLRQESLVPVAIALRGETDASNILVYDEGAGVSGTKGYDQRPKLSRLY